MADAFFILSITETDELLTRFEVEYDDGDLKS
jgi:hypothetical protein